jgi:hypothetical protein
MTRNAPGSGRSPHPLGLLEVRYNEPLALQRALEWLPQSARQVSGPVVDLRAHDRLELPAEEERQVAAVGDEPLAVDDEVDGARQVDEIPLLLNQLVRAHGGVDVPAEVVEGALIASDRRWA